MQCLLTLVVALLAALATAAAVCDRRSEYTCRNGQCVYQGKWCNGVRDCRDGSDEGPTVCGIALVNNLVVGDWVAVKVSVTNTTKGVKMSVCGYRECNTLWVRRSREAANAVRFAVEPCLLDEDCRRAWVDGTADLLPGLLVLHVLRRPSHFAVAVYAESAKSVSELVAVPRGGPRVAIRSQEGEDGDLGFRVSVVSPFYKQIASEVFPGEPRPTASPPNSLRHLDPSSSTDRPQPSVTPAIVTEASTHASTSPSVTQAIVTEASPRASTSPSVTPANVTEASIPSSATTATATGRSDNSDDAEADRLLVLRVHTLQSMVDDMAKDMAGYQSGLRSLLRTIEKAAVAERRHC